MPAIRKLILNTLKWNSHNTDIVFHLTVLFIFTANDLLRLLNTTYCGKMYLFLFSILYDHHYIGLYIRLYYIIIMRKYFANQFVFVSVWLDNAIKDCYTIIL